MKQERTLSLSKRQMLQMSSLPLDVKRFLDESIFDKPIKLNPSLGDLPLPAFFAINKKNSIWGCAVDKDNLSGFLRAHFECLERTIQKKLGINERKGFACGFDKRRVIEHGVNELLQYDALFSWWVLGKSLKRIDNLPKGVEKFIGLKPKNLKKVDFYQLPCREEIPCVLAIAYFKTIPYLCTGCKVSFELDKAIF